jgi:hypothetical protein
MKIVNSIKCYQKETSIGQLDCRGFFIFKNKGGIQIVRCLVIGADHLGTKECYLREKFGATNIIHWDGRKKKNPPFPTVEIAVVLTGFVGHSLMHYVKKEARKRGVKLFFLCRGKSELERGA